MKFSGLVPIKNNISYSPKIFRFDIVCPEIASTARPGQFVQIKMPEYQAVIWPRPFSIYKVNGDIITIYIKKAGKITQLLSNLGAGDMLQLTGPMGNGFNLPSKDRPVFLIAGGVGLPPLHFLCSQMIAMGHQPSMIHFYSGAKTANELFGHDEIKALGVNCTITTEDGSAGIAGLVTKPFVTEISKADQPIVFACGPMAMLKEVARLSGEFECYLSLEQLMPCGWGVCNGCAVRVRAVDDEKTEDNRPYRLARVCKEGPVFKASEVLWE